MHPPLLVCPEQAATIPAALQFVHVAEKPIRPHKVIRCRVDVGRGSEEGNNDVGDKHAMSSLITLCHLGTPMMYRSLGTTNTALLLDAKRALARARGLRG